jgi:hypothetical protein
VLQLLDEALHREESLLALYIVTVPEPPDQLNLVFMPVTLALSIVSVLALVAVNDTTLLSELS